MKIARYSINEAAAKEAQRATSFTDYEPNAATHGYYSTLERFENAVAELIERNQKQSFPATPDQFELVEYYADRYSRKLAEAINRENAIGASCPSVMIAGGSNFPVRKKQKQNAAMDKFWKECGELFDPFNNYYYTKIKNILTNKTIYNNDELALEKLQCKLQCIEEAHAEKLKINAHYRKHKTLKGCDGIPDEQAETLDKEIAGSLYKVPYPPYSLTSDTTKIRQVKNRIAEIEKLKVAAENPAENKYPQVDGVEVVENAEAMRIQLIFDGKPDEETRALLKSNGFHWSPSFGAWQKQLTESGINATNGVLETLSEKYGKQKPSF